MAYNMTEIDNNDDITTFFGNVNAAAGGLPGIVILVIVFIASFVYASNRNLDPGESFLTSSFLTTIISALFYFAEWVSQEIVIVFAVLLFVGLLYQMFK